MTPMDLMTASINLPLTLLLNMVVVLLDAGGKLRRRSLAAEVSWCCI